MHLTCHKSRLISIGHHCFRADIMDMVTVVTAALYINLLYPMATTSINYYIHGNSLKCIVHTINNKNMHIVL